MKRVVAALLGMIMGVILIFSEPGLAKEYPTPTDKIFAKIDKVWSTYKKGQYKKARKDLDQIKAEIEADPSHGDQYPNSVFYALKAVDVHVNDKLGMYRFSPKFSGKIIEEHLSAHSGYIVVQKGRVKKDFGWDTGTILNCNLTKGNRVTVYYQNNNPEMAVKIIPYKRRSGQKNRQDPRSEPFRTQIN